MKLFTSLMMICLSSLVWATEPPSTFSYQGKIYKSNGLDPVESSSVVFKVQIRSADGLCLLFEETHHRDMTGSAGNFVLNLGEGSNTNVTSLNLPEVFDNSTAKTGAAGCTYTPISGDMRRLRFSYDDGTEVVSLPTDQTIRSVPYAMHARTLEGLGKNKFIQVAGHITQNKIDSLAQVASDLVTVANGTSPLYAKSSDLPFTNGILNLTSGGVKVPDSPIANDAAINKNYADSVMGGKTLDLTGLTQGQSLIWNAAQNKWSAATPTSGTLTSITAGTGLTGGTITASGTIALASVGTAGAFTKVTTDAYGRVIAGAALTDADMPIISTAGRVSGSAINSGIISGSTAISTSGNIATSGTVSASQASATTTSTQTLRIFNTTNSNKVTLTVPSSLASDYALTLPTSDGSSGQILTTDGNGTLSWNTPSSLAVTSISATTPIQIAGTTLAPVVSVSTATTSTTGVVQLATDGGTSVGTVVQANDSRLNNSRAPAGSAGGDLSGSFPNPTVTRVQGLNFSSFTPLVGQVHRYSGGVLVPAFLNFSDLKTSGGLTQFPTNCSASQTMMYSAGTDTFSCAAISLSTSNISGLGTVASRNAPSSGDASASEVVLGADSRLTNSRAPNGSASGDLSGTYPAATVAKIQGTAVSATAPFTGQFYRYNGSVLAPSFLNISDLKSAAGLAQIPSNCSASQTMTYNSGTDTFTCTTIALSLANLPGLGTGADKNIPSSGDASSGELVLGNDSRLTNSRTPNGSAGGDLTGFFPNPTLTTTGVSAGTYTKITVDTKGRVSNGNVLAVTDIPVLPWSKISSGVPSTLSGYGITDAVVNEGDTPSFKSGLDAAKPSAGTTGRIYFATDTNKIYRDNGSTWAVLASADGSGGTVKSVTAGTGMISGTVTSTGTFNVDVGTTANKIVQLDNSGKLPAVDASQLLNMPPFGHMEVFDATGTFTPPTGVTRVYVQVWGAGGGGAGGTTGILILGGAGGAGGGGGGYASGFYTLANSSGVTVTVGAGGNKGAAGAAGSAGGDSRFGTYATAGGGGGGAPGASSISITVGGVATATLSFAGGLGLPSNGNYGGNGGSAPFGGSAVPGSYQSTVTGSNATAPGCGGGGGYGSGSTATAGGTGANGRVVVWY